MTPNPLDEIQARITDCRTYNFGMYNADKLAHEDAPKLVAALRAVEAVHAATWQTNFGGGREMCRHDTYDWPCPTIGAIREALG